MTSDGQPVEPPVRGLEDSNRARSPAVSAQVMTTPTAPEQASDQASGSAQGSMRRGRSLLVAAGPPFGWQLADVVRDLPESAPAKLGSTVAIGLLLVWILWPYGRLAAVTTFLGTVLSLGRLSEDGATLGAALFVALAVVLAALLPQVEAASTDADHILDALLKQPAAIGTAALIGSAAWVHGSRYGFLPGLSDMTQYFWNPQFSLTLWAAFGAVLASLRKDRVGTALVMVSSASALLVYVTRHNPVEACLAYCASTSAVVLQLACIRSTQSHALTLVGAHAFSLGAASAVAGAGVGAANGSLAIWRDHAIAGIFAGASVGAYRAFNRTRGAAR